jgi:hypothetical protein
VNGQRIDEYAASRAVWLTGISNIPANGFTQNWAKQFAKEIQASALLKSCEDWKGYAKRLALLAIEDQGGSPPAPEGESDWIDLPIQKVKPDNEVTLPDKYRRELIAKKCTTVTVVFANQSWRENAMGVRTYGWAGYTIFKNKQTGAQNLLSSITTTDYVADSELDAALLDRKCASQVDRKETQPAIAGSYGARYVNIQVGRARFQVDGLPEMPKPKCQFIVSGKYYQGSNYIGFKDVKLAAPLSSQ